MHEENQLNWQITGLENHSQCRTTWDHMEMPTAISLSLSLSNLPFHTIPEILCETMDFPC
jgi:hypothetical protein